MHADGLLWPAREPRRSDDEAVRTQYAGFSSAFAALLQDRTGVTMREGTYRPEDLEAKLQLVARVEGLAGEKARAGRIGFEKGRA